MMMSTSTSSLTPTPASHDLAARLDRATPADTAKGMLFNGVLNAVERQLGLEARELCRQATGEDEFIDFFGYPVATFLKLSYAAAELLSAKLGGRDAALRALGKQAVDDIMASRVGQTVLVLADGSPRRMLFTLPSAYRTAVSYGDRNAELASENRGYFMMKRDFMPVAYQEGFLAAAIQALGITRVRVKGRPLGPLDASYEISWE